MSKMYMKNEIDNLKINGKEYNVFVYDSANMRDYIFSYVSCNSARYVSTFHIPSTIISTGENILAKNFTYLLETA